MTSDVPAVETASRSAPEQSPLTVLQIAPRIAPGTGVGGVAAALEREFSRRGVETVRFTLREAHGGWIPDPSAGSMVRICTAAQVMWFSTVGTALAKRMIRRRPDVVAVCHNDVLAGDIYVNHGLLRMAMRARGHVVLRMTRNPLHLFTETRDAWRYGPHSPHHVVVNLTAQEGRGLRALHPRLSAQTVVIGNGIDVQRFRPADDRRRAAARAQLGLSQAADVVLFVGHEHGRKGLRPLIEALRGTTVHLLVVGGSEAEVARSHGFARAQGVAGQVTFTGRLEDPLAAYAAADVFAQPSAYEAYSLAVLEGLACGLPVISTKVGSAPDLITDGVNGRLCDAEPDQLRAAMLELLGPDRAVRREAARATAEERSWSVVADHYLSVARGVRRVPRSIPR